MSPTTIKICLGLHVKCTTFLPDFNQFWIFSTTFTEICPVGDVQIHADRQTDGRTWHT